LSIDWSLIGIGFYVGLAIVILGLILIVAYVLYYD